MFNVLTGHGCNVWIYELSAYGTLDLLLSNAITVDPADAVLHLKEVYHDVLVILKYKTK